MKTKYVAQKHEDGCGPVAVLNAMKWSGYRCGVKDLNALRRVLMKPHGGGLGTNTRDLERYLRLFGKFHVRMPLECKFFKLINHLERGHAAVMVYQCDKDEYHAIFITREGDKVMVANPGDMHCSFKAVSNHYFYSSYFSKYTHMYFLYRRVNG